MSLYKNGIIILFIMGIFLSACSGMEQSAQNASNKIIDDEQVGEEKDVLYFNLVWHQHQPLYYKDEEGVYTRPWVRVHATKDYYDMASILKDYPNVHATFNLTPVLLRQLDDFVEGQAKDIYWVLSEIPAEQLTIDQKEFILRRFFDVNWENIISRFPRYQSLLRKRGGADDQAIKDAIINFSNNDFRDLQVWFNLAWFDPDFLEVEPLAALVEKGENFTEDDKRIVFEQVRNVMAMVIPLHKELQDSGQIEVITTPYAHPILPLIYNTDLASIGNPTTDLPVRFSWPNDAIAHLERSVEIYQDHFGKDPNGLWPGEGAVAEDVIHLISDAGYKWMATGEPVLAASLGYTNFNRDGYETVQEADELYRPYYVQGVKGEKVAVFFRDWVLSDKVGFTYSQTPGELAAADFMQRLENIRQRLKNEDVVGPHIVSIVLDGENAWEYYPYDGKEFLHALYRMLSESTTIQTITPNDYLAKFPEQREIENLYPGAWFSPNYDTWIGEEEENLAWNYLGKVREHLAKYDITQKRSAPIEKIEKAQDFMYLAEGSDWFWWYGSDQDSGQDEYFDTGFRELLKQVYLSLDDEIPAFLSVAITPPIEEMPISEFTVATPIVIDGNFSEEEWSQSAIYQRKDDNDRLKELRISTDAANLYLMAELGIPMQSDDSLDIYLRVPAQQDYFPFVFGENEKEIGFGCSHLVRFFRDEAIGYQAEENGWMPLEGNWVGRSTGNIFEVAIPLNELGDLEAGDKIFLKIISSPEEEFLPADGAARLILQNVGEFTSILVVDDPENDDHGPGYYSYPQDGVFLSQVFDIKTFKVSYNQKYLLFDFEFFGPITNPWGSAVDLSLQTLDVYIDIDPGANTGSKILLPGRNAALADGLAWDYAVWAEGWYPAILKAEPEKSEPGNMNLDLKVIMNPGLNTITLRVPRDAFGITPPETWAYAAAVLSQDGFPSLGVWRVRDIQQSAEQWRLGGAPDGNNHTRIIDLVWPIDSDTTQEEMLSAFVPTDKLQGDLIESDFARIQMLKLE